MTTTATRELLYREAINEAIRQEMERDETVIIMGEEIAGGAGRERSSGGRPTPSTAASPRSSALCCPRGRRPPRAPRAS